MIATVAIADLGPAGTVRTVAARRLDPAHTPGLRWATTAACLPLASNRPPSLKRAALLAFWDDAPSAKEFAATHPVGQRFATSGFTATLTPLRAFGSWPGLPPGLPEDRAVPHDGPVIVFTLGDLRLSQAVRFLRTSRPAERAALEADGFLWGTALARPPFVSTVSAWADGKSAATYAFGRSRPQHSDAIAEQQRKDFHRQSAFIRFAPLEVAGAIDGLRDSLV